MKRLTTTQLLATLLCVTTSLQAQLAPPAGVIRIELPAGQDVLASVPFETASAAIQDVLSSSDLTDGCQVFKWDATSQSYRSATLVQGIWSTDANGGTPSEMTLDNGEGFIIRNPGKTDQQLFMAGTAVTDEQVTTSLYPGLSLLATPYSADLMGTANALSPDTLTPPAKHILMGQAYWHQNIHQATTFWTVTPPYKLAFSPTATPAITDITVENGSATLSIATHNNSAAQIDIFYRDIDHTGAHLTPGDWTLATRIQQQLDTQTVWTDHSTKQRPPITTIAGRYYAVASASSDIDANGIPDGADILVHGNANNPTTPLSQSTPSRPIAATSTGSSVLDVDLHTIYVDCLRGSDGISLKKSSAPSGSKSNPKRTIGSAISSAQQGDTVIVMEGVYDEKVSLPSGITMRLIGQVRLL
jgi:hypothetical protein